MNTKIIVSLFLIILGSIFLSIGYFAFNDNYSIQKLIQMFELYGEDTLSYKITVNQGGDSKECVLKGKYSNNVLSIDNITDTYKNDGGNPGIHLNCDEIKQNTDNFRFIGEWADCDKQGEDETKFCTGYSGTNMPHEPCDPDDPEDSDNLCPKWANDKHKAPSYLPMYGYVDIDYAIL